MLPGNGAHRSPGDWRIFRETRWPDSECALAVETRRQLNRYDVQAKKKVLAEVPERMRFQGRVGGGNDTHSDVAAIGRATA